MANTAYGVLLQLTVDGVNKLRQDELEGRAARIDSATPLTYNIPWYWGDNPVWKDYLKQFPNPRKEIGEGWRKLLHEIAATTGFGCFDERKNPQVKLMTQEEQKTDATKRIVYFISKRIAHLQKGDVDSLPGYNDSDKQLLETNFPQGVPLLDFKEILREVETKIGTGWKKEIRVEPSYAMTRL